MTPFPNTPGIYRIVHVASDRSYVGKAENGAAEQQSQLSKLQEHHHLSKYLQRTWDKYGPEAFTWEWLHDCPSDKALLMRWEKIYIDLFCSAERGKGFNV